MKGKMSVNLSDLPRAEQIQLLMLGVVNPGSNGEGTHNRFRVFKRISRDLAQYVTDYFLLEVKKFENSQELTNFYHGSNQVIIRLADYDVVIYCKRLDMLMPVSDESYIISDILGYPTTRSSLEQLRVVLKESNQKLFPPAPDQKDNHSEYWFHGSGSGRRCGSVSRSLYFDYLQKTHGILYIWELPYRSDEVQISYCKERPTEILPVAINNLNIVVGTYIQDRFEKMPEDFRYIPISESVLYRKSR